MEALFSIITTYLTHSINQHLHPNIKHQTESQPHSSCLKLTSQLSTTASSRTEPQTSVSELANLLKERSTPLRLASREVPLLDLESQMTASPAAETREAAPKASSLTEKSIQLRQERKVVKLHLNCSQQAAGFSMVEFGNGRV